MIYELQPTNGRKSFYGKAQVHVGNGIETLYSYGTLICQKLPTGKIRRLWDGWSATTGSHIKSFCGLDKKAWMKLPYEG